MVESSLQQHRPQHSLPFLDTLCTSHETTDRNSVITLKYSIMTVTPQKTQKALIASIDDVVPMKNAMQSVREVIVMEGPACYMPLLIRSDAGKCIGV